MKRVTGLFIFFVAIVVVYSGYVLHQAYQASKDSYQPLDRGEKSELRNNVVKASYDPISILIMGVEDYETDGEDGRTDTLIVVTLDPQAETMKMLSIPRDTRVEIVGRDGFDKINHAHVFGGKNMTINTVEKFLDIPIDYYITVNFDGFKDIIDEIGGITVDVPFDFTANTTVPGGRAHFTEGEMTLDGEEALAYVRMRKSDPRGDFGRIDRQKQVIKAAMDQAMSLSNLFKVDNIARHLGDNIETNLKPTEILALQQKYASFDTDGIDSLTLEGQDNYTNNIYYFIPDEESVEEISWELKSHLKTANPN